MIAIADTPGIPRELHRRVLDDLLVSLAVLRYAVPLKSPLVNMKKPPEIKSKAVGVLEQLNELRALFGIFGTLQPQVGFHLN